MNIVVEGHLNSFYDEGQYNLVGWIIDNVFASTSTSSTTIVYDAIQASDLANGEKDLTKPQIIDMITWMIGKVINGKVILKSSDDINTYTYTEVFGCENKYDVDGTDNGDGTRTIDLAGWKPVGSQIRWNFITVTHPNASFSSSNSILGTFTGLKGTTYNLMLHCLIGSEWKTKTFDVRFNI